MANFFKEYGAKAYREKHKDDKFEEIKVVGLAGHEAPNPKTLGNKKQSARNRAIYGSISEDENN